MALSVPVASRAIGLFLLLLACSSASAQVPETPELGDPQEQAFNFIAIAPQSFVELDYLGNAMVPLILKDLSRDSTSVPEAGQTGGNSPSAHVVRVQVVSIGPEGAEGWQVFVGHPMVTLVGGETFESSILVQTSPQLNTPYMRAEIEVTFEGPNGYTRNQTLLIDAKVKPYSFGMAQVLNPTAQAGQFEQVRFQVAVTNDAVYPDSFRITASTDKSEFKVVSPPSLYVPAKETRYTNVTVLTPKGNPYELGLNTVVTMQVESVNGGGSITTVGTLKVRGAYVSTPWIPAILVGLVSAGLLVRERSQNSELSRLEKGLPRRVAPTPRQTVLLAELKRRDPEAYEAKRAALAALYAARRQEYKGTRKERVARDRAEHKQARLELKEERKRKKLEAIAAKKQAKLDKKAAKKQAKIDRKEAKAQRKIDKKEAKALAKRRKVLEKQKAKLEKQHAKAKAKEAKAQAKAEKAAARQAKREARAAAKQQKRR